MILLFQVLFCAFVVFAVCRVLQRRREGLLGSKGMIFWVVFWLLAAIVVVWPYSASTLANTFGIGRGSDLIVYAAVALLFYLVFKLHIKLESIGRDVTKLVRRNALRDVQRDHDETSV